MKSAALTVTLGLLLVSGSVAFASGDHEHGGWTVGSGNIQSEDRQVPPFTAVEVDGSGNVTIRQSDSTAVSVETDDNVLPLVRTEVVGGVLHLGLIRDARVMHLTRLEFSVAAPRVGGITISGSGNAKTVTPIRADGMRLEINGSGNIDCDTRASRVDAAINGSGTITVRGTAQQVGMTISGSGSVFARDLESQDATVKVSGSGDVTVSASTALDVTIVGSGSVRYGGGAAATVHRSGSGSVSKF